jgi:hypothetical protein
VGIVESMVRPDDAKDVLAVIGLYEDGDEDCNNALIDLESGLNPATVDEVLDYLWKSVQIEGIMTPGGRNPSLVGILRLLPDKERQWGDDGGASASSIRFRGSWVHGTRTVSMSVRV